MGRLVDRVARAERNVVGVSSRRRRPGRPYPARLAKTRHRPVTFSAGILLLSAHAISLPIRPYTTPNSSNLGSYGPVRILLSALRCSLRGTNHAILARD